MHFSFSALAFLNESADRYADARTKAGISRDQFFS